MHLVISASSGRLPVSSSRTGRREFSEKAVVATWPASVISTSQGAAIQHYTRSQPVKDEYGECRPTCVCSLECLLSLSAWNRSGCVWCCHGWMAGYQDTRCSGNSESIRHPGRRGRLNYARRRAISRQKRGCCWRALARRGLGPCDPPGQPTDGVGIYGCRVCKHARMHEAVQAYCHQAARLFLILTCTLLAGAGRNLTLVEGGCMHAISYCQCPGYSHGYQARLSSIGSTASIRIVQKCYVDVAAPSGSARRWGRRRW